MTRLRLRNIFRGLLSLLLIGSLFTVATAQDTLLSPMQRPVGFPADLDAVVVDSFFTRMEIDLRSARHPDLYFEVFRWYKTCYRYGGNSTTGIDCSHFINMLYEKIYGFRLAGSSAAIYEACSKTQKNINQAEEGDLVFFKIRKKHVSHIGIYLQNGKFAHASTQAGVIISSITEPYYQKYFYKIGKAPAQNPDR